MMFKVKPSLKSVIFKDMFKSVLRIRFVFSCIVIRRSLIVQRYVEEGLHKHVVPIYQNV